MFTSTSGYVAGIALSGSNPFASMEINDQKNGVNGIVTDSGLGSALRMKKNATFAGGIWNGKTAKTFSIVGR